MKFKVTALGGAKRSLGTVVGDIVRYLLPRSGIGALSQRSSVEATAGPAGYYTDRGEEPGRWRGRGASQLGLSGQVHDDDLAQLLSGRHPTTGERLITARGSAGRRPRLGVGTQTRWGDEGEPLYDLVDAASALGLKSSEAETLLHSGQVVAAARLFAWLADLSHIPAAARPPGTRRVVSGKVVDVSGNQAPTSGSVAAPTDKIFLVPVIDSDGHAWISDSELTRCEASLANRRTPEAVAGEGDADELLSVPTVASTLGVTPRYVRTVAKRYIHNRDLIEDLLVAGETPAQAYLVAHKDARGRWLVRRADLVDFVTRRSQPAVRVAFDVTLTTEKSYSVLALLAEPPVGARVLSAIQSANDLALDWLEDQAAFVRVDQEPVKADGWAVATFRHMTSRALDPFVHHHNIVGNTASAGDVGHRALDARHLYRHAKAASALATTEARWRLTSELGVRWRPGRRGGWEIAGIPDSVLSEFSQRRNEVDEAVGELEQAIGRGATPEEVEQIILATRPAKRHDAVDDLRATWWRRTVAVGFGASDLAECYGTPASLDEPEPNWIHERLAAPDGICQNVSIFGMGDILAALCDLPAARSDQPQPLVVPARRLIELATGFLVSPDVVQLTDGPDARYTTVEMLAVQERIVARFDQGLRGHTAGVAPRHLVEQALRQHPHLTDEQRHLVEQFCSSGCRTQCAIGHPGAGKTTSIAAARAAWESAGWRVVGAAVKGEAARILAAQTGIETETLAWWLAHEDPMAAPLDARTVLVVDEASTISDRDFDRLGWLCDQKGATLRLIGDPGQHGAVEAGGMFRVLCESHPDETPALTMTQRVRDPNDRAAADALRRGAITQALDHLNLAEHLHIVEDELDFYRQVLQRWWHSYGAGDRHPMVDGRNVVRRRLNRLAHRLLQAAGEVGQDEITADDDRRFAVGDRVIARAPARELHPQGEPRAYVRNGAVGSILALNRGGNRAADTIAVDFDGIGVVVLPRSYFDVHETAAGTADVGLDHAYSVTSYAVQGSTSTVSTSRIDERSSRAEMLVDITRGREANHVYLTPTARPEDIEQLPRVHDLSIAEEVTANLVRSRGERTAWEIAHRDSAADHRADHTADLGL